MLLFWTVAAVVFAALEAATVGLTSIWFACGAIVALLGTLLGAALWLQIGLFLLVSAGTLFLTRPLAKKYLDTKHQATNYDRLIGAACMVTEDIDNMAATGTVTASGAVWTARSDSGEPIAAGTPVRVLRIEGVKLIVTPDTGAAETK